MTRTILVLSLILALSAYGQGPLTPPGAPAPTMKTLTQVEPRTPIGSLPFSITAPGSYYVTTNLSVASGNGIDISASDVTLDLTGFTLRGGLSGYGIYVSAAATNLSVLNGSLVNWNAGLAADLCINGRFENLAARGCSADGFDVGSGNRLRNCTAMNCGDDGFQTEGNLNVFEQCRALSNQYSGFYLALSHGSSLRQCEGNNSVASNGGGIIAGDEFIAENCRVSGNKGYGILGGSHGRIQACISMNNGVGMRVNGIGSQVAENDVHDNSDNYNFAQGNRLALVLSQIPETLDWPCSVKLAGSLTCSVATSNGITVNADDVTIDLAGHTLYGIGASSGSGIYQASTYRNLTVLNGNVVNWRGPDGCGVSASGKASQISGIRAATNIVGIVAGFGGMLNNCSVQDNIAFGIVANDGSAVSHCMAQNNHAIGIWSGSSCALIDCIAQANDTIGFLVSDSSTLQGCIAKANHTVGISAGATSLISECTALNNYTDGIVVSSDSRIINCLAEFNGRSSGGAGIRATSSGNRLEGNTANQNSWGIFTDGGGNFIVRNTCSGNTANWSVAAGNACLVLQATTGGSIVGNSGGVSPGSTDPNANFTY